MTAEKKELECGQFESEFLASYLKFGLGAMPKADIDALVMALLDRYGYAGSGPLSRLSNQVVSERLRTPLSKVKRLRYEAALKFGGRVEDQAKGRLLASLASATLEPKDEQVCLIIEDTLARYWLQGQLKIQQQIFDHSFNTEMVRVSASGFFSVLEMLFDKQELNAFRNAYERAKQAADATERSRLFGAMARKFAEGAAKASGSGVFGIVKSFLSLP